MQTFLPSLDYDEAVAYLDQKRLGKQRVETFQILQGLFRTRLVTKRYLGLRVNRNGRSVPSYEDLPQIEWTTEPIESKRTWGDHVVSRMWAGHELALLSYQRATCVEWTSRGYKDTCLAKSLALVEACIPRDQGPQRAQRPFWMHDGTDLADRVTSSHRASLLLKDFAFYSQYGWAEEPANAYVWPVADV